MQAWTGGRKSHAPSDGLVEGAVSRPREPNGYATVPISSPASVSSPSLLSAAGANFIEHRVSKMDTLAGVAIKYGVEIGDIRRMNGLVTDLQMFAHKSLQIPLPGRHPPSPVMANGSTQNGEKTPLHQPRDIVESLQSLKLKPSHRRVSPAMCSLQGYYGLKKPEKSRIPVDIEMAVYKSGKTLLLEDDGLQKTKKIVNGFSPENSDHSEDLNELERSIRRRLKADDDPSLHMPEILLKEESSGGVLTGRAGKGLALRPKLGSRTDLDDGRQNSASGSDSLTGDPPLSVRKSSSASNLSEPDSLSSIWPTSKWSLKPDAIARPIFDGLPKPIAAWRNKAALD